MITHFQYVQEHKPPRECSRHDMNFGGECFNCGYSPRVTVKLTTACGDSWISTINGTYQDAVRYYLQQSFNLGNGPDDRMVTVVAIEELL